MPTDHEPPLPPLPPMVDNCERAAAIVAEQTALEQTLRDMRGALVPFSRKVTRHLERLDALRAAEPEHPTCPAIPRRTSP
jgi:hypothetical protein